MKAAKPWPNALSGRRRSISPPPGFGKGGLPSGGVLPELREAAAGSNATPPEATPPEAVDVPAEARVAVVGLGREVWTVATGVVTPAGGCGSDTGGGGTVTGGGGGGDGGGGGGGGGGGFTGVVGSVGTVGTVGTVTVTVGKVTESPPTATAFIEKKPAKATPKRANPAATFRFPPTSRVFPQLSELQTSRSNEEPESGLSGHPTGWPAS
jgi:hypothetical protein